MAPNDTLGSPGDTEHLTNQTTGRDRLETRFAASSSANDDNPGGTNSLDSPVPWRNEVHELGMVAHDVNGDSRSVNDGEYSPERTRPVAVTQSEAGESEGAVSVFCVTDYRLDAAFQSSKVKEIVDSALPQKIMDRKQVQKHLGLKDDPDQSVADSVKEKLELCLCLSATGDDSSQQRQYLPIVHLYGIFTIEIIYSLMRAPELWPNDTSEELCGRVRCITGGRSDSKCRLRILAILTLSENLKLLHAFIRDDIGDQDLPLQRCDPRTVDCTTRGNPKEVNKTLFQGCGSNALLLYHAHQSSVHVPFFNIAENELCSYRFGPRVTLPWKSCKKIAVGGSGTVFRIEIDPNHHNYKSSKNPLYFALKKNDSQEIEKHNKELAAHEKEKDHARLQKGNHLIRLLLTIQHGQDHYLMFEYADGSLQDFWDQRTVRKPELPEKWATEQCFGVATALKQIHGLSTWQQDQQQRESLSPQLALDGYGENRLSADWGRHGDISPKNILWFSQYDDDLKDHLVISDLGLTRYHSMVSRSLVKAADIEGFTEAYGPPELALGHHITRKADIWSLGCVFLEFCTWYLKGKDGIDEFRFNRLNDDTSHKKIPGYQYDKFFNLTSENGLNSAIVISAADTWIDDLMSLAEVEKSIFAQHMLRIIKDQMLIVTVAKRESIDKICTAIKTIQNLIPDRPEIDFGSPTVPVVSNIESEVDSMTPYATGNIASPDIEYQGSSTVQQNAALPRHAEGKNDEKVGAESPSHNTKLAPDVQQEDYGNLDSTQPVSQLQNDVPVDRHFPHTQTPNTTENICGILCPWLRCFTGRKR